MSATAGTHKRRLAGLMLAGTVAAGAGLAACGGGSTAAGSSGGSTGGSGSPPTGTPTQVLAAMTSKSLGAGTAKVAMKVTADFSGIPNQPSASYTIDATGAFDLGKKEASLDMNLGQLAQGKHLRIFVQGTTAYLNAADLGLTGTKPWISYDATAAGGSFDFTQITQSAFSGPQLLSQVTNPTAVGTETVGGVQTTHYRGTLDLSKALDSLSSSSNGGANGLGALLGSAFQGNTLPVDAWIDGQDRLRRFTFSMDLAPVLRALLGAFGNSGTTTTLPANFKANIGLDMTLSDFGADLNLAPPPADQVGPAPPDFKLPGSS